MPLNTLAVELRKGKSHEGETENLLALACQGLSGLFRNFRRLRGWRNCLAHN